MSCRVVPCRVRSNRRNILGDDPVLHIHLIGQAEALHLSDIAELRPTVTTDHRSSDSRANVVVPGVYSSDGCPEEVKQRIATEFGLRPCERGSGLAKQYC